VDSLLQPLPQYHILIPLPLCVLHVLPTLTSFTWSFLLIFSEEYMSWSSPFCSFLQPPVTSSLFGPNILHSILFSNTLSVCTSLNVTDQVSYPYEIQEKFIKKNVSGEGNNFTGLYHSWGILDPKIAKTLHCTFNLAVTPLNINGLSMFVDGLL
jgi:hypothetical protein